MMDMRGLAQTAFLLLVGFMVSPMPGAGQRVRSQVNEGNRLYSEGLFTEAHERYLEALLEDPESNLIRFNDGNALYQGQDFQQAMERYLEAAESGDPALQNAAWYNLGNSLFRQQQLEESLEAYKQALRANPADTDAKHNLERVLEQLQQQEEEQDNQEENQNQDDEQDQEDQQNQDQQGEGEQDQQDQESDEGEPPPQDEAEQQEGQPQPQPGEMTPEEAERLLEAIREDPDDVNRKRLPALGKRPRKKW